MNPKSSGVYAIKNVHNGKLYIGSAVRFSKRWAQHKTNLRRGDHDNIKLQNAWRKHGEAAFQFLVLEVVADLPLLVLAEQRWIDSMDVYRRGYNMCPTAGNCLGKKHSIEAIEKMRVASLGRRHSEEAKAKCSAASKAMPKEVRERIAAAHKDKKRSLETRRRLSIANTGKKHSPETRAKLAAIAANMPQAQRDKLAAALRGRKNGPHSPESIEKMRAAKRDWWARRKASVPQ